MIHKPYPGYENQFKSYLRDGTDEQKAAAAANGQAMMTYTVPEGMNVEDKIIAGPDAGSVIKILKQGGR